MKKNIVLLSAICLLATPLFARSIRENGGFRVPAAAKISFFSPGNGIDYELKAKVDALIQNYQDQRLVHAYSEQIVGMEGETNVCVQLLDFNSTQQMFEKLRELVASGEKKTRLEFASSCHEREVDEAFRPRAN